MYRMRRYSIKSELGMFVVILMVFSLSYLLRIVCDAMPEP